MTSRLVLAFFIFLSAVVFSCNNGSSPSVPKSKNDTTVVLGLSVAPDLSKILEGYFQRVITDSATIITYPNPNTTVRSIGRDTAYLVPYSSWVDTTNNKGYLDSATNRVRGGATWLTAKKYVRSGWDNADSAINYLKQFLKK